MSEENKINQVADIINTLKTNPKAMYAVAGVAVVILFAFMTGGEGEKVVIKTTVSTGQTVTIHNPNVGDTVLWTVPGLGVSDEEEEQMICLVKSGTTATVDEELTTNFIPYIKLSVKDGDCAGKSGWTPKVNIKG